MDQTIALHIIGFAGDHWRNDGVKICGVHLVIAGHDHHYVGAKRERFLVATHNRCAHALVFGLTKRDDPRIPFGLGLSDLKGRV